MNNAFTARKIGHGLGAERVFPLYDSHITGDAVSLRP